jgi:hypothetical protein
MSAGGGSVESALGYPSQFKFATDGTSGARRPESVIWSARETVEESHRRGVEKAERDADAKRARIPDISADDIPAYVGFLEASVARIRGAGPFPDGDEDYCTPAVFEVEHVPEPSFFSHSHIQLNADFLEVLKAQIKIDGTPPGGGELTEKKGRVHAINMLIRVFELAGLHTLPA